MKRIMMRVYDFAWHMCFHARHWFDVRFTNRYK